MIKKIIGVGSYGFAYLAIHRPSNQEVLLKQLRKRIKVTNSSFQYEMEALSSLSHENIPILLDSFTWGKKQWIAMSYFPAKNIEDLIFEDKQIFSEQESLLFLQRVGQVVAYIHENGIVHRDLRIPNILYDQQDVYLIDFGLARRIGHEHVESSKHTVYKQEVNVQSDIYALGHLLLFLLYSSFTAVSRREKSWQEELDITVATKMMLEKMLGIQTEYKNMQEVLMDVERIL